jgi:tetratricopeptide (TPR) repeat protein
LLTEATETLRRVAPDGSDTATALDALAGLSWYQGHLADAERIYTELIASLTRRLGANHRDTLKAEYDLATTYAQQKQLEKAVVALQIVLDRQRRAFGPDDLDASKASTLSVRSTGGWAGTPNLSRSPGSLRRCSVASLVRTTRKRWRACTTWQRRSIA